MVQNVIISLIFGIFTLAGMEYTSSIRLVYLVCTSQKVSTVEVYFIYYVYYIYMSGFMKTVWKNETRTLSGRFFLARNYLQSRR